jgi:NADP-dependent 3-hydroxy acid dehydrogenase YdfG
MEGSAVITGASSDIGRAIAVSLAALNLKVHLWGRDADRITATADACRKAGASSVTETLLDVRNSQAVREAARAIVDGPESLKAVVWAAGTFQWGGFDTVDEAEMDDVLASTFTAAAVAARAFLPALIRGTPSTLIFVGSGAGRQAYPDNAAYVAAKHGLRGLAQALHLDVCDEGVTVSVISTGLVNAGAGRFAPAAHTHPDALLRPEDVATAVRFIIDSPSNVCPTEIVLQPATRHA